MILESQIYYLDRALFLAIKKSAVIALESGRDPTAVDQSGELGSN
jgi:hypothetical protein